MVLLLQYISLAWFGDAEYVGARGRTANVQNIPTVCVPLQASHSPQVAYYCKFQVNMVQTAVMADVWRRRVVCTPCEHDTTALNIMCATGRADATLNHRDGLP